VTDSRSLFQGWEIIRMQPTECVSMSAQELDRLTVIERVLEKRLCQVEASEQLRIMPRHLRRLIKRYRHHGAMGKLAVAIGVEFDVGSSY